MRSPRRRLRRTRWEGTQKIGSDILLVHIKPNDRLKAVADAVLSKIARGELRVIASR